MARERFLPQIFSITSFSILDNPPSSSPCHSHYYIQNDLIPYYDYLWSINISNKTEQNALSFQSLTILLGSIYLLNINCCKKCRGSWKYWKSDISHNIPIPVMIPVCEMAYIPEREGNEKIHSHISVTGIMGYHSRKYPRTGTGMARKNEMIW